MIGHIHAVDESLPPMGPHLYEYITAGNGIFLRAHRPGMTVIMPIWRGRVRGLADVTPGLRMASRVPMRLLKHALLWSVEALPNEALFWFGRNDDGAWTVSMPRQLRSKFSVRPCDQLDPAGALALIDLHSHNSMPPFFSSTDNKDETGFRIYAVAGSFNVRSSIPPALRVRVGVYGHFWDVPAACVFEMPSFIRDVTEEQC